MMLSAHQLFCKAFLIKLTSVFFVSVLPVIKYLQHTVACCVTAHSDGLMHGEKQRWWRNRCQQTGEYRLRKGSWLSSKRWMLST